MQPLNLPIEMISFCSIDGRLRPLRFRFEDSEHQLHTIHILEILSEKELIYVGRPGRQYLCRATVGHQEKVFELRYAVKDHRWLLFRMLS